jgi:hypothetical protein
MLSNVAKNVSTFSVITGIRSTKSRKTKETIKHYLIDGSAKLPMGIGTFAASYVIAFHATK